MVVPGPLEACARRGRGRRCHRRGRRGQRGQVLVETTMVLSVLVFVILGALQLGMLEHGRIMTEYAAYNAARAGIVHDADWNVMQNAAMIGALPIYGRTDGVGRFLETWAKVKVVAEATQAVDMTLATFEHLAGELLGVRNLSGIAPDFSLVKVEVKSPTPAAFERAREWQEERTQESRAIDPHGVLRYPQDNTEIDFDDVDLLRDLHETHPGEARLGVEVRLLYPLRIPLVNWIIFQLWYVQERYLGTRAVRSDLHDWTQMRGKLVGGSHNGEYMDEAVEDGGGAAGGVSGWLTGQRAREADVLRTLAAEHGVYLIPLRATYAMQMQSNVFEKNLREPVWFTAEDL